VSCDHKFIVPECQECEANLLACGDKPTYTDDVFTVMRETITALREQVAELRRANDELSARARRLQAHLDSCPLPEGM
jgi:hypothetical protein